MVTITHPPTTPYMAHGAQPRFVRGGPVGVLALHGFSAAPSEVVWLGQHLAQHNGCTVYVPRLAGHGTHPDDMARMTWQDWYASAYDGYEVLRQQCEVVFVMGLSMGALLALLIAARADVGGVMAFAPPLRFAHRVVYRTPYLHRVRPWSAQPDRSPLPAAIRAEQARRGEPVVGRVHYARWSTRALAQLVALSATVRAELGAIRAPLGLVLSAHDGAVPLDVADILAFHATGTHVEAHTLHTGGHVITQDVGRDEAFALAQAFVTRHAPPHPHDPTLATLLPKD